MLNSTLRNCIVYRNVASEGSNHFNSVFLTSCTFPLPAGGPGNLASDPAFVNPAAGDFRLRPGSPCIDAGTNLSAILTHDLAGLPRPLDGNGDGVAAFDVGPYEFNPYRLTSAFPAGGWGLQLTLQTEPGRVVRIERSTDLIHWEPWFGFESPVSALDLFDPTSGDQPAQFYRTVREP